MAADVDAANRALQKQGEARISTLDENSKAGRAMKAAFGPVRQAELRAHRWNFAVQDASLPALSDAPIDASFTKQFQLPADCLRVLQVGNIRLDLASIDYRNGLESLFQIRGRKIVTSMDAPLFLLYIKDVTDVNQWDALFFESFSSRLAIETCDELTQSLEKKAELKKEYVRGLRAAKLVDAIENPPEGMADSSWTLARL